MSIWSGNRPATQEDGIEQIFIEFEKKNSLPSVAVLGPRSSGKSHFLVMLKTRFSQPGSRRPVSCLNVDLQNWRLDAEDQMLNNFADHLHGSAEQAEISV